MMFGIAQRYSALAVLLLSSTLALSASQGPTESVSGATGFPPCDALISAGLGNRVLLATSDAYEPRVQSWWSANARFRPWCFVQPHTTQEVSLTVKTLSETGHGAGDWHIAVRSGGHGPPGSNNIANGVTIDLGMMNSSRYDPDTELARVQPGAAWKDVYYDLLRDGNVTATGGRDGGVGVGGYLLGGGMSFYTGTNGFGCDEVVNFEIVLANGSIVDANSDENPSLWKALKGGGFNFGIVTGFDIRTMPAVDLAYGQSFISSGYSDEVVDAVVEFTGFSEERGEDALVTLYTHDTDISEDKDTIILLIRANTKGNLNTTSFDSVTKIPTLTDSSWEHISLADAANNSQIVAGTKNVQKTLTLPNTPAALQKAATLHTNLIKTLSASLGPQTFKTQMFFQPFPSYLPAISARKGGNMLGLENTIPASNAILFVLGVGIKNGDDEAVAIAGVELGRVVSELEDEGVGFVYMNYADAGQDPLGGYGGGNVGFLKDVARGVDPEGFWQGRVPGGFKVGRVG